MSEMAKRIFEAKLRTGLYDHYDERALQILKEDCERAACLSFEMEVRTEMMTSRA